MGVSPQFKRCLDVVLEYEGGWAWHKDDPGGATNKGVTIQTFKRYYPGKTIADLRNITRAQVERIYYEGYWLPIDGDGLGPGVDLAVFDLAVNSGVGRATKMFRKVMRWHRVDDAKLIDELCDNRMAFLRSLRHWRVFGRGWTTRVSHVRTTAKNWALLRQPNKPPTVPRDVENGGNTKAQNWVDRFFEALFDLLGNIFK